VSWVGGGDESVHYNAACGNGELLGFCVHGFCLVFFRFRFLDCGSFFVVFSFQFVYIHRFSLFFVLSGGQNITLLYLNGVSVLLFSMGMILTMAAWPERACNNVVLPGAGKGNSACWPRVESMCL
jgi:hypothetical protein